MTTPLVPLRLLLMLVLSASPLVASAMAEDGQWSRIWADPFSGTVQAAEEEEPTGETDVQPTPEEATLWSMVPLTTSVSPWRYQTSSSAPPPAPLAGAPTPPPEQA